ncbi:MAG: 16S rRNA (cytosine(1402)-N(4))-methyltransferase RsmH [Oscillospiraceae bacterium]|nr:16S rRNA (cytosine(1402)-N(4))-methyltransferase RsmH [Oscillospiraceae bacterium]
MEFSHKPVLLREAIEALNIKPDGVFIDSTAGGGGHSSEILRRLTSGRLIMVDRDPQAIEALRQRFGGVPNADIVHDNYHHIEHFLSSLHIGGADGILVDCGVSSHQLAVPERGFSYQDHHDAPAPLDMRMSMAGMSAAELVNTWTFQELRRILFEYGEEKFAPSIARNIVKAREEKPIETTLELVEIVKSSMPASAKRDGHPARRTFQAIRIAVNGELDGLDKAVCDMFGALNPGGRLVMITFHSLEDRIVKKRFAAFCSACVCPKSFPICVCGKTAEGRQPMKAIVPGEEELKENPRSRSARLRVIEKL